MDICYIQVDPQYPRGHLGGVRVSQIQKFGEAVKRLDRFTPNLSHICWSTWEWIYAKQIALETQGGAWGGGGLGVKHSKVWGSCQTAGPIVTTFGIYLQIHLGMDIRQANWLSRHKGALGGGGFRRSTIQKSGEAVRLAPTLVMSADPSGNGHRIKSKLPLNIQGGIGGGGLGGHICKSLGKLLNGCTDWHQIWSNLRIRLGMDIRQNIAPRDTRGT